MATGTRTRNLFDPASDEPYKLSRSKLELFLQCPRCFYLDRRLGIGQPPMPAFTLNSAVDHLLKREFDAYRTKGKRHPLQVKFGIDGIPFSHPLLEQWRDNRKGVQFLHEPTSFLFFGSVDDLWQMEDGSIAVVDYKSTSIGGEVTLEGPWKEAYKRQVEMYQWLLRRNGLTVNETAYFVYVNADRERPAFDGHLAFSTVLLPYRGDDAWVEEALQEARTCLDRSSLPQPHEKCPWCAYRKAAGGVERL